MAVIDSLAQRTAFGYDSAGHKIAAQDAQGHLTTNIYDAAGHLTYKELPSSVHHTFSYDSLDVQTFRDVKVLADGFKGTGVGI